MCMDNNNMTTGWNFSVKVSVTVVFNIHSLTEKLSRTSKALKWQIKPNLFNTLKMGPSFNFSYFSPNVSMFSRVLRVPAPPCQLQLPRYHSANPGFFPRLQLGVIASVECLVCPLYSHTTDSQQWKYMSGLVLMVFRSGVNSNGRSDTDTRRHGRISFYPTFISRPLEAPSMQTGGAWKLSSNHGFHPSSWSQPDPMMTPPPTPLSFVLGGTLEWCCLSEIFMPL